MRSGNNRGGGGGGGRRRGRGHGKNRSGGQGQGQGQNPNRQQGQRHGQGQQGSQQSRPQQQPQTPREPKLAPVKSLELPPKKFAVIFHETFDRARADIENLKSMAAGVDQLNIVINEEGNMDDPVLSAVGKVFAGAAWTLIHQRRVEDGWYEKMQPAGTVIPTVKPGSQQSVSN